MQKGLHCNHWEQEKGGNGRNTNSIFTRPPNDGDILIPTDSMYAGRMNKLGIVFKYYSFLILHKRLWLENAPASYYTHHKVHLFFACIHDKYQNVL